MVMAGRLRSWAKFVAAGGGGGGGLGAAGEFGRAAGRIAEILRCAIRMTAFRQDAANGASGGVESVASASVSLEVSSRVVRASRRALLGFVGGPGFVVDEAEAAAVRSEAAVGVVDAQVQAELGARGEHAVGLVGALADEVVDEDAGVGFGAIESERAARTGGDFSVPGGFGIAGFACEEAALMPAMRPWQAASSYPEVPLIWPAR